MPQKYCRRDIRDLKQHDAAMRRRGSLARCLFNCYNASVDHRSYLNRNFVNDRRLLMTTLCCLRSPLVAEEVACFKKARFFLKYATFRNNFDTIAPLFNGLKMDKVFKSKT